MHYGLGEQRVRMARDYTRVCHGARNLSVSRAPALMSPSPSVVGALLSCKSHKYTYTNKKEREQKILCVSCRSW